jgi:hypothetical protein
MASSWFKSDEFKTHNLQSLSEVKPGSIQTDTPPKKQLIWLEGLARLILFPTVGKAVQEPW